MVAFYIINREKIVSFKKVKTFLIYKRQLDTISLEQCKQGENKLEYLSH